MSRALRNRKRRANKGEVVRVSRLVYETLDKTRFGRSWDCVLRRLLGLPDRAGNEQPLIEGILETMTGQFIVRAPTDRPWDALEQDAYEIAIITAARTRQKRVQKPLRMRELP